MSTENETKKKNSTNSSKKKTNTTPKKKVNNTNKTSNGAPKKKTNNNKPSAKKNNIKKVESKNLENTLEIPIKKKPKHAQSVGKKKTTPKKTQAPKKIETPKVVETPKIEEEVKVEIKKADKSVADRVKKVEEKTEVEKVIDHINEKEFDPKEVSPEAVDTKEERDQIAQAYKDDEEVTQELKEIKAEIKQARKSSSTDKKEKLIDLGILIVIVGLLVLVVTTYLTGSLDLSYQITNYLVIGALSIEVIGILVIIFNSIKKK